MVDHLPGLRVSRALLGDDLVPTDDVWLQFDAGLITAIGTGRPPLPLPEARDAVAMPGLVDCHVHLAMSGTADVQEELARLDHTAVERAVLENARRQVYAGVTTVRDLGSPADIVVAMAQQLLADEAPAPTVVAAGAVSSPEGHGHFLARHATGPDEYRRAVAAIAAGGAHAVKLFATGGVVTHGTTPGATQMSLDELTAAVEAAHEHGLPVAAHAHGEQGVLNAIAAGVDSVEHFSYAGPEVLERLRGARTRLVSTLVATERFIASDERNTATAETLAKIVEHAPHERAALRMAVAAGAPLAVGTDAGTTFNPHGAAMQEQAHHLVSAGATRHETLQMLTIAGARVVGEPAGRLEVGARADVLILDDDPIADLHALGRLHGVVLRGRLVTELSTSLR